jgi:hypothetical protein
MEHHPTRGANMEIDPAPERRRRDWCGASSVAGIWCDRHLRSTETPRPRQIPATEAGLSTPNRKPHALWRERRCEATPAADWFGALLCDGVIFAQQKSP